MLIHLHSNRKERVRQVNRRLSIRYWLSLLESIFWKDHWVWRYCIIKSSSDKYRKTVKQIQRNYSPEIMRKCNFISVLFCHVDADNVRRCTIQCTITFIRSNRENHRFVWCATQLRHINLPPKHGPKATAQTNGWIGIVIASLSDMEIITFIIIAVTGTLSTRDDSSADICEKEKSINWRMKTEKINNRLPKEEWQWPTQAVISHFQRSKWCESFAGQSTGSNAIVQDIQVWRTWRQRTVRSPIRYDGPKRQCCL